jgi:hypothetical protein
MENKPAATPDGDVASQIAAEEKEIKLAMKRLKLLHIKVSCAACSEVLTLGEANQASQIGAPAEEHHPQDAGASGAEAPVA